MGCTSCCALGTNVSAALEGAVGSCLCQLGWVCAFLLSVARGGQRPQALPQRIGKKSGLAIKLWRAQSPAHITTKCNPHGVYKRTKNAWMGQPVSPAVRRSWTLFMLRRRSQGAFFVQLRRCSHGGSHEAARVSLCRLPAACLSARIASCLLTCNVELLAGCGTWDVIRLPHPHIHDSGIQHEP